MEPQVRIGLANLTQMAFAGIDLQPLRSHLLSQCVHSPEPDGMLMDLSIIDQLQGNREMGLEWQARALERQRIFSTNRRFDKQARVLVFAEPGHMGANTPIEFLLQGAGFEILTCYPDMHSDLPRVLPAHDIAFCAAPADSAQNVQFCDHVRRLTARSGKRVLNLPTVPVSLDRDSLSAVFPYVDGLRFPRTVRVTRSGAQQQAEYSCVIRPVGSHAGAGLARLDTGEALHSYLAARPEQEFFISEYIDYADRDGSFRKQRVIFVDGRPFPCHMAVSGQWDLWYLNAGMESCADKRREEAAFMDGFDTGFARRHARALDALAAGIGLDYFGIDCAEDRDGNLVVFEADNALIVHDMDSEAVFPYKRRHMRRIFRAFEDMLYRHAHLAPPRTPALAG